MYYILLNNKRMMDAEGKPIQYQSKGDALAAIDYIDFTSDDKTMIVHYLDYYKIQDGIEELF